MHYHMVYIHSVTVTIVLHQAKQIQMDFKKVQVFYLLTTSIVLTWMHACYL